MKDDRITRLLRDAPLPDEAEARERSWRVVEAAYAERPTATRSRPNRGRLALALATVGLVLILVLTPAGAKVVRAIRDVAGIGERNASPALSKLPAAGSLAVDSPVGPWVVQDDGAKRLLGNYRQVTWSPHGLYLAVARGHLLAAVTPGGQLRWTIPRRATVRDPRWSPSGNRVAYRSGSSLRLAAGDASSDAQIDSSVSRVAPAWRPIANLTPAPIQTGPGVNVLAYVDSDHRVVVLNTDTGTVLLRSAPQPVPFELAWSSDGKHLLAVTRRSLYTYAPTKPGPPVTASLNRNQTLRSAAFIPGSRGVVATIQTRTHGQVRSAVMSGRPDVEAFLHRRLFGGPGRLTDVVPAPDGSSVLVAWPDADQWLFIDPVGGKVTAVDHIARQFDPGASGPVAFPHVEGWCCAASTGG